MWIQNSRWQPLQDNFYVTFISELIYRDHYRCRHHSFLNLQLLLKPTKTKLAHNLLQNVNLYTFWIILNHHWTLWGDCDMKINNKSAVPWIFIFFCLLIEFVHVYFYLYTMRYLPQARKVSGHVFVCLSSGVHFASFLWFCYRILELFQQCGIVIPHSTGGGILFYLCPSFRLSVLPSVHRKSVLPSVQDIFCRIFLSNYWWQKSNIWSQTSYKYAILW